jgi:hypothetical protein
MPSARRRATAAWMLALVALTAAACGSASDQSSSDSLSSDTRPPAERDEPDDEESTTTTRAPSSTTSTTTTTTVAPGGGSAAAPLVPAGWTEFDDGGARMAIPSTWTPEPSTNALPDQSSPTYLYLDGLDAEFRRNINLITQRVGAMDLAGYVATSDAQLTQLADTVIEQGPTELSGLPAHRWHYVATFAEVGNLQVEVLSVAVVNSGLAWLITYTATPDGFAASLPEVEEFLRTVQLPV